jgi:hypothetical protein
MAFALLATSIGRSGGIDPFLAHRATLDLKANLIGNVVLILDTILVEKIIGDRRRHASYQGIVEQLRSFHRKAVSVTFEMINIKVLREDQFADETRKSCVLGVIEKRFLDIESQPTVGSYELHGSEEGSWGNVPKTESCNAG